MLASLFAIGKIILVDLVMSGDNAIIIALATKGLRKKYRNKARYIGIAGAAVLRIALASVAVYLLQYPVLKYIGGILLLYVAWNFFRTLKLGNKVKQITAKHGLRGAVLVIIMADFSLSLDNVLAVASIAENLWVLALGLIASILMMLFASTYIARMMKHHEWVERVGLVVIIHAALSILMTTDIAYTVAGVSLGIWGLITVFILITYLYIKNVIHVAFHLRKHHLHNHLRLGIVCATFLVFLFSDFVPWIHEIIHVHVIEWLTVLFICYMMLLELVMQQWSIDRYYMKHQSKH